MTGGRSNDTRAGRPCPGVEETARTLVEAVVAGHFETARAQCSPDIVYTAEGSHTVHGHEGLRQLMELTGELTTDPHLRIHHVLSAGDTVALDRTVHLTIDGARYRVDVGAFLTVRNGVVTQWTDYQDLQELTRALGH